MRLNRFIAVPIVFLALLGCNGDEPEHTPVDSPDPIGRDYPDGAIWSEEGLASAWREDFAHEGTIASVEDVNYLMFWSDNKLTPVVDQTTRNLETDLRYEFHSDDYVRFVSESDGYAVSFPQSMGLTADRTLARYAQKFSNSDITVRFTMEKVAPYDPTEYYYGIYTGEWLTRYIANKTYVAQNRMSYYEQSIVSDETIIPGCAVNVYSINAEGLEKPWYKIAMVRPLGQWSKFGLIVCKCRKKSDAAKFMDILKSYRITKLCGRSKNFLPQQKAMPNPKWNAETKAYYQKLLNQKSFDFGVFSYSMPGDEEDNVEEIRQLLSAEKNRLETRFGRGYDIMPTYKHVAWYDLKLHFPRSLAAEFAGGNGFNGKPVLQFTYQFTHNNNDVSSYNTDNNRTVVLNILRGEYDSHFERLADDIKAYGKPVLFRLNNEMNSDWTSYCGMILLIDPDLFIESWKRLYNIFERKGVDNCIWIFNPIAQSCPYSNWGEALAYYPGNEYVQALGVTNYEMGNSLPMDSFRTRYTRVYNDNRDYFGQMPWIISEFACGAGGITTGAELRNASAQAAWVRGMFSDFSDYDSNPYLHPLKGGVWFSCNDVDGQGRSVNYLYLDPRLEETLDAFHDGLTNRP